MPAPTELRVFISSTFQDLQEERGYLMKHVFPEIRMRCRERGIEFTEIDLRWGLTHEEGTLGRIIRTCFEEIDKCRPFFLGILGSRYGWIPKYLDIQKDPELLRKYPWIEQEVLDGASLLELEFMHGVLGNAGEMSGAFFYARENISSTALREEERGHLALLKQRMHESTRPVRSFTDLHSLGDQVRADMLAAIDQHWPADERNTRTAVERRGHESFSAARRHAYIANPENLKLLNAHVAAATPPMMVVAISGMGKSALLAFWSNAYKLKHPGAFVITHFIGTTPSGAAHGDVVRRILAEIKERANWDEEIPSGNYEMEQALPLWLARLHEPLVLVIDALNQLDDRARDLSWLPAFFPSHIRVILSATPGAERDAARLRGWHELELNPLTIEEREALTVRFLGEYHKGLSAAQINRIACDAHSDTPLFLRTVLEELRLFGYFQELDAHIEYYLSSRDLPDLFQRVLQRMENDFGAEMLRSVMTLIWASRSGLAETELMAIANLTRAGCSQLLIALDYHLMQREGRRTFFHDYLRRAVEARYLTEKNNQPAAHIELGKYFSSQPVTDRRVDEEPWQWQQAEEWKKLQECISSIEIFRAFVKSSLDYELFGYWNALGDRAEMDHAFDSEIESVLRRGELDQSFLEVLNSLGIFYRTVSRYDAAEKMLRMALGLTTSRYGADDLRTLSSAEELAGVLYYKGEFGEAEKLLRNALAVREGMTGADDIGLCKCLDTLTIINYLQVRLEEAEQLGRRSLRISELTDGPEHLQTAGRLSNLGSVLLHRGKNDEALTLMQRALHIQRIRLGNTHPTVAQSVINIGVIFHMIDHDTEAVTRFNEAIEILEQSLGQNHEMVASAYFNLGDSYSALHRFAEARQCLERARDISVAIRGRNHLRTIAIELFLASLLADEGKFEEAVDRFTIFLPLRLEGLTPMTPRLVSIAMRFVQLLRDAHRNNDADAWERKILGAQKLRSDA